MDRGMKPIQTLIPDRPPIELIAYYPQFSGYYPECELQTKRWFVDHVAPDWIMFDAGANIGYYAILFSQLAQRGKIYAFEPTETIEMLRLNLGHHDCLNVTPLEIALGSASGKREEKVFKIWGDEPEHRLFDFATVDDMVSRLALSRLDCIKIDVDSFDFEVLRGAEKTLKRFNPWVVVELNHALSKRNQSVPEALEWLYSIGYDGAHVTDHDNYILHRDPKNNEAITTNPSMLLSFESRPLIMPAQMIKGRIMDDVFALEPRHHNSGTIAFEDNRGTGSWRVSVPGPRWAYAVSWLRTERRLAAEPLIVEVDAEVSGAAIGIGCIKSDDGGYNGRETEAKPTAGIQTLTITVDNGSDMGYLVLRNIDSKGIAASAVIHSIRAYAAIHGSAHLSSAFLFQAKRRMSLAECSAALEIREPSPKSAPPGVPGIDIVPVEELGSALNFSRAFVAEIPLYRYGLADFKTELDESAIFSYIYREFQPLRHLEFGTWEGWGATLCAAASNAEIWTVNLSGGERDAAGNPVYAPMYADQSVLATNLLPEAKGEAASSDSGAFIGWRYRAAGFESRVHQILCDSRDLDTEQFGPGFFDSVLIDGGHSREVATSDTNKALRVLRSGGLIIWHDFCPETETLARNEAPRGVVAAIVENYSEWRPMLRDIFWIRPSWILVGVKA
jgi:FkbM family methyltransferase